VRPALPPRLVDWGLFALVAVEAATGLLSLAAGRPADWPLFWIHRIAGLALLPLLGLKLYRVRGRLRGAASSPTRAASVALAAVAAATLGTGVFWTTGGNVPVGPWTTLNVHVGLGLALLPLLLVHLRRRAHDPRGAVSRADRRDAVRVVGLLAAGALVWRGQRLLASARGSARRFTGSKPTAELSGADTVGGAFPVTSWVADDPEPVDRGSWTLRVTGRVRRELQLPLDDDDLAPSTTRRATLDCTSGWYTVQDWGGVRVGDLLSAAGVADSARHVRFVSVTGYRWSLPLAEAREALLATHVGGDPLSHGHGAPARLVAPGRRGFQWVKWVERIEVRARPDPAQWVVTLVSGFD